MIFQNALFILFLILIFTSNNSLNFIKNINMLSVSSKKSQRSSKLTVGSFRDSLRDQARKDLLNQILRQSRKISQIEQTKQNHQNVNINLPIPIQFFEPSRYFHISNSSNVSHAIQAYNMPHSGLPQQQFYHQKNQVYQQKIINPIRIGPKIRTQRNGYIVYQKIIGKGTYSKVYEGVQICSKLKVAVKQVEDVMENQLACLKGFKSPHIVEMFDYWQQGNRTYIVLEFCEKNLREEKKMCSKAQCINYFLMVAEGLDVFVKHNTIHRDIKFQNILIKNQTAKLSDFGLAKPLGSQFIVQSLKCGTPYTMAPEILFNHSDKPLYTIKCDIWSMAVLLHQILYDSHPYKYNMHMMAEKKRVKIKKMYPILDQFIDKALEFDENKRIDWPQSLLIFEYYRQSLKRQGKMNIINQQLKHKQQARYLQIQQNEIKIKHEPIKYCEDNWIRDMENYKKQQRIVYKQQRYQRQDEEDFKQKNYKKQKQKRQQSISHHNLQINKRNNIYDRKQLFDDSPRLFIKQKQYNIEKPIIVIQRQNKPQSENGFYKQKNNRKPQIQHKKIQYGKSKSSYQIENKYNHHKQYNRNVIKQPNHKNYQKTSPNSYALDVKSYLIGQGIILLAIGIIYMCF